MPEMAACTPYFASRRETITLIVGVLQEALVKNYFELVLDRMKAGRDAEAQALFRWLWFFG